MAKKPATLLAYSPAPVHCPCCGCVMAPVETWNGMSHERLVQCTNHVVCELAGKTFAVDLAPVELRPA